MDTSNSGFYNPVTTADDNSIVDGDETNISLEATPSNRNRKGNRRSARNPCGYLVYASEARKRLIKDNPTIPFGEMSRMIGEQWRRLTTAEKDKYEEKARERAKEHEIEEQKRIGTTGYQQQISTMNSNYTIQNDNHGNINNNLTGTRMVNGYGPTVTMNGHHYQNMTGVQMNGMSPAKPTSPSVVTCPPKTQRLVHSEAYLRYIENLKSGNQYITDWPKQLKASSSSHPQQQQQQQTNNINNNNQRSLPAHWLTNGPGLYNNVVDALWSMRDNMFQDVVRIRNVLSEEW